MDSVDQSTKLLAMIKELSDIQSSEIELMLGVFRRTIKDIVENYINRISEDFSFKCEFYGKKIDAVKSIKDEIINGYQKEFEKISEKLEEQYVNLIFELQEVQLNQMISITNYKKMLEKKKDFEVSEEYTKYKNKLAELIQKRDDAETKKEFDELEDAIANLENPIVTYEKSIDALVQRYGNYCALEEECYKRLEECMQSIEENLSLVMKYDTEALTVAKKGDIFSAFKKVLNKIFAGKKFEKQFIKSKKENIAKIEIDTEILSKQIADKTVEYVATLMSYKLQVKEAYEQIA